MKKETVQLVREQTLPIAHAVLWFLSCMVSIFYDFQGIWPVTDAVRRIVFSYWLFLIVEFCLGMVDLTLLMKGAQLKYDHFYHAAALFITGFVFVIPLMLGLFFIKNLFFLIFSLFLGAYIKYIDNHISIYVDKNKIRIAEGYQNYTNL